MSLTLNQQESQALILKAHTAIVIVPMVLLTLLVGSHLGKQLAMLAICPHTNVHIVGTEYYKFTYIERWWFINGDYTHRRLTICNYDK